MWDLGPYFLRLLYPLKARYSNKLDQIRIISPSSYPCSISIIVVWWVYYSTASGIFVNLMGIKDIISIYAKKLVFTTNMPSRCADVSLMWNLDFIFHFQLAGSLIHVLHVFVTAFGTGLEISRCAGVCLLGMFEITYQRDRSIVCALVYLQTCSFYVPFRCNCSLGYQEASPFPDISGTKSCVRWCSIARQLSQLKDWISLDSFEFFVVT